LLFFYEILFVAATLAAIGMGEFWNRSAAVLFLVAWFALTTLGYASFGARLAQAEGMDDEERRWFQDARDGLRHLRFLFGIAAAVALVWRLLAG
jgi:hypothetical protein